MKKIFLFVLLAGLFSVTAMAQIKSPIDTVPDQFANIDDVKIHYKICGKGDPLILLHGSMESIRDWSKQINDFARHYKVIALDNRGHGMSTFTDRKLDYALLSDDVVKLMDVLKIDSANVVGFGDGGIIGLYLAINHPEKIRKLVAIGANYKIDTNAVYPETLKKVKEWNTEKMTQYIHTNFPNYPNDALIVQFTKRMQTMLLTEPNLSLDNLHQIKCPVLLINGDHDIIKLSHTSEMFENIKQCYMSIIPGAKHYPQRDKPILFNTATVDFLSRKFIPVSRF